MKHQLSFCEIKQLSDNIFEAIPREDIVINKKCIDEYLILVDELRDEPFGLLINCKYPHSRSFKGSRDIGKHPLEQKTAIFYSNGDYGTAIRLNVTRQIKQMTGHSWNHKVFSDRDEAIRWLSDI